LTGWIGPSLATSNVPNPLADPTLQLHDGNGALLDSNDDWGSSSDQAKIQASDAVPMNPKESAVLQMLPADPCAATGRGINNTTSVGYVEIYQLPKGVLL
jgi:hypothetical protein